VTNPCPNCGRAREYIGESPFGDEMWYCECEEEPFRERDEPDIDDFEEDDEEDTDLADEGRHARYCECCGTKMTFEWGPAGHYFACADCHRSDEDPCPDGTEGNPDVRRTP